MQVLEDAVPEYISALQLLVNRCPSAELRKALIVECGLIGCVAAAEAMLLISANQLETA